MSNNPDQATRSQRAAASKATAKLKAASTAFLTGNLTEEQYHEAYTKLSAVIQGAGLQLPTVAWVDIPRAA